MFVLDLVLTAAGAKGLSQTGVPVDYGWSATIQARPRRVIRVVPCWTCWELKLLSVP